MSSSSGRTPRAAGWRLTRALGAAMVLAVATVSGSVGAVRAQTAADVADQILAAQRHADQLAAAWSAARDRAEALGEQLDAARRDAAAADARYHALDAARIKLAIDRLTGTVSTPVAMFSADPEHDLQKAALSQVVIEGTATDLDAIDALRTDLLATRSRLDSVARRAAAETRRLAGASQAVERQLDQLAALHDRLSDAEIRRAYEAKLAVQRQADAAQAAPATPEPATPGPATVPVRRGEPAAPAPVSRPPRTTVAPDPPTPNPTPTTRARPSATTTTVADPPGPRPRPSTVPPTSPPTTTPRRTTTEPTSVPKPSVPKPTVPKPTVPPPPPPPPPTPPPRPRPGVVCAVDGPNSFSDWWHAPRSGGRVHLGLDMIAKTGTPVVAVVSGRVTMKTMALGGLTASLVGDDGNRYFYGHLSAWAGGPRHVRQGEVIGYVGMTGNAPIPHLHFEYHPGGGDAANPYSMMKAVC